MMNFDTSNVETFQVDGTDFTFNMDRVQYIADEQLEQYESQVKKLGKLLKKKKKQDQVSGDIISLYQEWNVKDNDEILYLLFSEKNEDVFTDVTTENDLYSNPSEELDGQKLVASKCRLGHENQ